MNSDDRDLRIDRRNLALKAALTLLGATALGIPESATTAQSNSDPERAATYYSRLESRGQFSRLYDLMHKDAQRIIPEEVVVGWYENEFAPRGPGVVTVEDVDYVTWTWDGNGKTYRDAAEVTYTQPFDDGSVVRDTIHLAEWRGDWLWFFGPSREFIEDQIAIYSPGSDQDDRGRQNTTSDAQETANRLFGATIYQADLAPGIIAVSDKTNPALPSTIFPADWYYPMGCDYWIEFFLEGSYFSGGALHYGVFGDNDNYNDDFYAGAADVMFHYGDPWIPIGATGGTSDTLVWTYSTATNSGYLAHAIAMVRVGSVGVIATARGPFAAGDLVTGTLAILVTGVTHLVRVVGQGPTLELSSMLLDSNVPGKTGIRSMHRA